jgi:DNA repair protein RecN (Recombination protein N)
VLCITHLPQVASCAHHHLLIEKQVTDGRTTTSAAHLDENERVREIARLLAGETITDSALIHAAEMLRAATWNS